MVLSGLDVLVSENFARLKDRRVGVLAHPASVDKNLRHIVDLMYAANIKLEVLLGPEHGINGEAQDMEVVDEHDIQRDPVTGARIYSLYGAAIESLHPKREMFEGIDVLVIDLQDVGARYYTFAATMMYAMKVAGELGIETMVLDRPNPLGGRVEDLEGPAIDAKYFSFVGAFDLPIRHGLTLAEYAQFVRAQQNIDAALTIVPMQGWKRDMDFESTGLPWVMPSPNMPTPDTAWIYPGQCLLEGTNLSEGRGTTRPFELCGAPYLNGRAWAARASLSMGPGFFLRPTIIRPTFQKHAKQRCGALQVHVTDRWAAKSLRLSVALLEAAHHLAPSQFDWRRERYEYVSDRLAIDLLFGSDQVRKILEAGASTDDILATFKENEAAFAEKRRSHLIY
jgi:uncharacterized protein YbbC (DUF1343 family)